METEHTLNPGSRLNLNSHYDDLVPPGTFPAPTPLSLIIAGVAQLDMEIKYSYSSPGIFGTNHYRFGTEMRFVVDENGPRFTLMSNTPND